MKKMVSTSGETIIPQYFIASGFIFKFIVEYICHMAWKEKEKEKHTINFLKNVLITRKLHGREFEDKLVEIHSKIKFNK